MADIVADESDDSHLYTHQGEEMDNTQGEEQDTVEEKNDDNVNDTFSEKGSAFLDELGSLTKIDSVPEKKKRFRAKTPRPFKTRMHKGKKIGIISGVVVVLALVVYVALAWLPRVDVIIAPHLEAWSYSDAVTVDSEITAPDVVSLAVPGEVFSKEGNGVFSFPASGEQDVERNARGTIYVVNEYSSEPQALVATTRFETPDGKIYRLVNRITVPGAEVVNGTIKPSRIAAEVIADQPGEEYNIGPVEKFTIPGFTGSDKFEGFYGTSESAMTGGMIGLSAYPTQEDIDTAEQESRNRLRDQLGSLLGMHIPEGFSVISGSQDVLISSLDVQDEVDENGNFSVVAQGEVRAIIFKEEDVLTVLRAEGKNEEELGDEFVGRDESIEYLQPHVNWQEGMMSVPVEYNVNFWRPIDGQGVGVHIAGKKEIDVKSYVLGLPGVDSLTISFWPFWVGSAPSDEERISVEVQ